MRRAVLALVLVGAAALVVAVGGSRSVDTRTLRAAFASAIQLETGQPVRIAGRKVGTVEAVDLIDGEAVVVMEIDDAAWPLRRGTVAKLRYGGPVAYAMRYIELVPGRHSASALPDGGILTDTEAVAAVEFDEVYRTFGPRTRGHLGRLIGNAAEAFAGSAGDLRTTIDGGAQGLGQIADLMSALGRDPHALGTLIRAGAATTAELDAHERALGDTIANVGGTLEELAEHSGAQRASLDRLPATLRQGARTLSRLERSADGIDQLASALRPGARELRAFAPRLTTALRVLGEVAPQATSTLRSGARALPQVGRFLAAGEGFLPRFGEVLDRLAPMLACIRPYAPEFAGLITTWTGFQGNADATGSYVRASEQKSLIPIGSDLTSKQLIDLLGDRVTYAFPRPPGLNAGTPRFLPECGAGRDALDPAKDPEAR